MTKFQRRIFVVAGALALIFLILAFQKPARPRVAFHLLRYSNDTSGLQALLQMTNSGKYLLYHLHTQVLTNGVWRRSSTQPPFGSFPPYGASPSVLPVRLADYNVWVPVPGEGATWRVELEILPYDRSRLEQKLITLFSTFRVNYPFYSRRIRSPEFKK
jgi:hypothetical protein